jgi:hypothetical protein
LQLRRCSGSKHVPSILDEREREAVRVVAENVPGIAGVKDHLVWLEPITGMFFESPDDAPSGQG